MNSSILKTIYLLMATGLILVMGSCHSTRSVIKEPIKEEGADYLFDQLKKHEIQFEELTIRFSATYYQEKNKSGFSGQIRIKRDSIIWISISPALGIEVVRLMITQDSMKMINRLEKTYYNTGIQNINQLINSALDFNMLQAFLTGNDFSFYESGKFRASIDSKYYRLNTSQRSKIKKYLREHEIPVSIPLQTIWLNPENFKISTIMIKELDEGGRKMVANYSDYLEVEGQRIPLSLHFDVEAEKKIELDMKYSKISINKEQSYSFNIPLKYELKDL